MEGGSLLTKEFVAWSKGFVLFNHITTHIPEAKYDELLAEIGGFGFPSFYFMDADGRVMAQHTEARDAGGFQKTGKKAQTILLLQKKFRDGDKSVGYQLLTMQLEAGPQPWEEVEQRIQDLGELTPEQKAKLDPLVAHNEGFSLLAANGKDQKTQQAAIDHAVRMQQAGRVPPGAGTDVAVFWQMVGSYADSKSDTALMEAAVLGIRPALVAVPQFKEWADRLEAKIKKLRDEGK